MPCECKLVWREKSKWAAKKDVVSMHYLYNLPVFAEEVIEENGEIFYKIIGVNNSTESCKEHRVISIGLQPPRRIIYKKGF